MQSFPNSGCLITSHRLRFMDGRSFQAAKVLGFKVRHILYWVPELTSAFFKYPIKEFRLNRVEGQLVQDPNLLDKVKSSYKEHLPFWGT